MSFYQSIAPYYDYIFPPASVQVDFVASQAGEIEGQRILEAGCGTGNLAAALASKGAFVEALDLDEEMIETAREKHASIQSLTFREGDILRLRHIYPYSYFEVVISFGNTIVHLSGTDEVTDFFRGVAKVLRPGGLIMVQIINYDHILEDGLRGLPTIENEVVKFERYYDTNISSPFIDFRTILTVKASGKEIRNVVKLYPLRRHQIEAILPNCGFGDVAFYGSFKREPLAPLSMPLIFSARKV